MTRFFLLSKHAFRFHYDVEAIIFAATFRKSSVSLNAERIEKQKIRLALVVKSVEVNKNIIVVKNVVASGNCRANRVSILFDAKSHIKIFQTRNENVPHRDVKGTSREI